MSNKTSGHRLIWAGVVLLIILRQDSWFWNDPALVLGMFPVGLAWQIGVSIAAAMLWYVATRIAWPVDDHPVSPRSRDERAEVSP